MTDDEKKKVEQSSDEQGNEGQSLKQNFRRARPVIDIQKLLKSPYKTEYQNAMKDIKPISLHQIAGKYVQRLKKHKIQFNPTHFERYYTLDLVNSTINSQIVTYRVAVSYFKMYVTILNLDYSFSMDQGLQFLGGGSYGNVYVVDVFGKQYACKNVMYEESETNGGNQEQMTQVAVMQYCISKVCSALQVGLEVQPALGFDLILYTNCVQFFMEQGVSVTYVTPQIKRELMENLSLMHSVRLIHNDVKPENIMYSHQLKKYVFIDFGISEFIYETLGKMSIVVFRGSYNYCLAQLKQLFNQKFPGVVDLYYNDLNALNISLKQIEKHSALQLDNGKRQPEITNQKKTSQNQSTQNTVQVNADFVYYLVLMVYILYTQQAYRGITLDFMNKNKSKSDYFYLQLANILSELPPSAQIHQFCKRHIHPIFHNKEIQHPLESIYTPTHYVPWLKQNPRKSKKYENRLIRIDQIVNHHLTMLNKPASIRQFMSGFSITYEWKKIWPFFICYMDFMQRNILRGKQFLVLQFFKHIFQDEQAKQSDQSEQQDYERKKQIDLQNQQRKIFPFKQQIDNLSNIKSKHLQIQYKHYLIMLYIQFRMPKTQISEWSDLWMVQKLMYEFKRLHDIKRVLSLYDIATKSTIIHDYKRDWFKWTFDIFATLHQTGDQSLVPEMQRKIQQMQAINSLINEQTFDKKRYDIFYTQLMIKFAYFFLQITKFSSSTKRNKRQLLEQQAMLIQEEYERRRKQQKIAINNELKHKIAEMKFCLGYMKKDAQQTLKYGRQLYLQFSEVQTPANEKQLNKNLIVLMANTYLQIQDIANAKKLIYGHIPLQISKNIFTDFTSQMIYFKLAVIQNRIEDAQITLKRLSELIQQNQNNYDFATSLMNFYLRFYNRIAQTPSQDLIQSEILKLYQKVQQWPLILQSQAHQFIIYIQMARRHFSIEKLSETMIKYRKTTLLICISPQNQDQTQLSIEEHKQIGQELKQFLANISNISYLPSQKCLKIFPQSFLTLHSKYFQLINQPQTSRKCYILATSIYSLDTNLTSIQLWINWYRSQLKNPLTLIHQTWKINLTKILTLIFQRNWVAHLFQKQWFELYFDYDEKIDQSDPFRFQLPLILINKLQRHIESLSSKLQIMYSSYQNVCQSYLISLKYKKLLKSLTEKLIKLAPQKKKEMTIFLYFLYQKIQHKCNQLKNFDGFLKQILMKMRSLSTFGKNILKRTIYSLLAKRFQYAKQKIHSSHELQNIVVFGFKYTIAKIYEKERYFRVKHLRSAFSQLVSERQIINFTNFQFSDNFVQNDKSKLFLVDEKFNIKIKKLFHLKSNENCFMFKQ